MQLTSMVVHSYIADFVTIYNTNMVWFDKNLTNINVITIILYNTAATRGRLRSNDIRDKLFLKINRDSMDLIHSTLN